MGNVPASRKFLIFSLSGAHYAIDLAQVAEVGDPPQTSPIPLAPAYYNGALNFHGDIVAVMNLALFLDLSGFSTPGKIIVLHKDVASLAFLVDSVVRIISEEEVSLRPTLDNLFSSATLCLSDGEAIQLDLGKLVPEAENRMPGRRLPSNINQSAKKA